jgi:glycosyltransferase involved in cell wall biosynthesis
MKINIFAGHGYTTTSSRILPLARALESHGAECKVIMPISWCSIASVRLGQVLSIVLTHSPADYIKTITDFPDVVIIGRVSTPQIYLLQMILRKRSVKVIFDMDDAIFLSNTKLFGINVRPTSFSLEKIIKTADFVTTNGHYLLNYVRNFNQKSSIIPDPIDCQLFSSQLKNDQDDHNKITIGWEGNPHSHYKNLVMLVKPLERLARKYDIRFKIVSFLGDQRIKQIFEKLEHSVEVDYGLDHWVPLTDYAALLSDFDILVAPLLTSDWYEGKSSLRVGIGMAMGIPVVASPVGEQKYVIKHGINGFLAKNEEEWYKYLQMLIEDEKLRNFIGKSGRETAKKKLSSSVCGKKLFDIITRLMQ